jgi:hypothetical protein
MFVVCAYILDQAARFRVEWYAIGCFAFESEERG